MRFTDETVSRFHFHKKGTGDKENNRLLIAFAAPGTGKSRLAQSLPDALKTCGDPELETLARNDTLTILISFNGDTKYDENFDKSASSSIGVRALASYFGFPWDVLMREPFVSKITLKMCLETILKHHRRDFPEGAPETVLYLAVDDVGGIIPGALSGGDDKGEGLIFLKQITNSLGVLLITSPPGCFFVSVLTGTIFVPVTDILRASSHPYAVLGVPLLPFDEVEALLSNRDIIDLPPEYLDAPEFLRLVADIGGVPRVVEWFLEFLDKNAAGKPFETVLISRARGHIEAAFSARFKMVSSHISAIVRTFILRSPVDISHVVTPGSKLTYGDLEAMGSIFLEYDEFISKHVVVIPLIALQSWNKQLPHGRFSNALHKLMMMLNNDKFTWQNWEEFCVYYDILLCSMHSQEDREGDGDGTVLLKDFYRGALVSKDLKGLSLVLPRSHTYEVYKAKNRFPETRRGYKGTLEHALGGNIILNAAGAVMP